MGLGSPGSGKDGRQLRFLEHVKMEHRPIWWPREKAVPLWTCAADGCHLARNTPAPANQDADR